MWKISKINKCSEPMILHFIYFVVRFLDPILYQNILKIFAIWKSFLANLAAIQINSIFSYIAAQLLAMDSFLFIFGIFNAFWLKIKTVMNWNTPSHKFIDEFLELFFFNPVHYILFLKLLSTKSPFLILL